MGSDCFIDGPDGSPRDAVHLLYAGEKVRPGYATPSAEVTESESAEDYDVLTLQALVRMKLNSFRRTDQVHLMDMLEVGHHQCHMAGKYAVTACGATAAAH